ncbi:hypothetical protein [Cognatiluteimonas weifangensis]|uniref:Secreted protein n=1 Tax=Cognatiluteimonas weifangensis TaxID=2303539 RepID=A0A372DQW5_9GAMM|nr:hypothetical protein [Luteimonas weifangensis]RFP61939.1 hypothetical protein D0Y53_02445 [Luteimonas weifangensis]
MRRLLILFAAAVAAPVLAADPAPEIRRAPVPPQALGVAHTLRTIPEACARLQGEFSGDAAAPYRFAVVRTSPGCRPRARLVDAAQARPSPASGWILNDLIRVPSAACATQQAVVRVWRQPAQVAPPALDPQGRARVYLEDSLQQARAGRLAPLPAYAVSLQVEGLPCPR